MAAFVVNVMNFHIAYKGLRNFIDHLNYHFSLEDDV
jgi:iron-sulfur cluster repair protein YtfE (RIC family)